MVNWAHRGSAYTTEQAVEDFAVGFIGDLAGGGLGELISKYGAEAVAKGLFRMGIDVDRIIDLTGYNIRTTYKIGFRDESAIGHIFKSHHNITDTEANRNLLLDVANNPKYKLGKDMFGVTWYAKIREDGTQVWVRVVNGKISTAGINLEPRKFDPKTGLNRPTKP